jgi:hypothetical protein
MAITVVCQIFNVYSGTGAFRCPQRTPSFRLGFLAVCRALYDYQPQAENELEIKEGELLYILEKSASDDWWKAKKRASDDDDDEPVGLIPNNYVEEVSEMSSLMLCTVALPY